MPGRLIRPGLQGSQPGLRHIRRTARPGGQHGAQSVVNRLPRLQIYSPLDARKCFFRIDIGQRDSQVSANIRAVFHLFGCLNGRIQVANLGKRNDQQGGIG